jgi:large repetitive protein
MRQTPSHPPDTPGTHRKTSAALRLGAAALAVGIATAIPAVPALAAPNPSSTGTTTANVDVSSVIALTNLTPSFTLAGLPGDTATDDGAVTMNVMTDNATGYNVTVLAAGPNLEDTNGDDIPVADLEVNDSYSGGTAGWVPLSSTTAVQVFIQSTPSSGASGDTVTNDYRITIPTVPDGSYSGTLDYVASINP